MKETDVHELQVKLSFGSQKSVPNKYDFICKWERQISGFLFYSQLISVASSIEIAKIN